MNRTMATPDGMHHVSIHTTGDHDYQEFLARNGVQLQTSTHDLVVPETNVVDSVGQSYGDHIIDNLYSPMIVLDGGEIPAHSIDDSVKSQIQALITNISGRLPSKNREEFSDEDDVSLSEDDDDDDGGGNDVQYEDDDDDDVDDSYGARDHYYQIKQERPRPRKRRTQPAFTSSNYSIEYLKNAAEFQKKKTVTACSLNIEDPASLVEMKSLKSRSRARRIVQVGEVMEEKPHKSKPFSCRLCHKAFGSSSNLRLHERTHTGKRPYKCVVCNKSFSHKSNLNRHERIHTGYTPYVCGYCGKGFAQSTGCKEHVKLHLLNADKLPYPCNRCTKRFASQAQLDDHLTLHDYQSKVHQCPECGENFSPLSALHHHMKVHTGSDHFLCQVCGAAFNQSHNLTIHMRRHSNFKPFKCNWCDQRFCRSSDLSKHEELHRREENGGKPLQSRGVIRKQRIPRSLKEGEDRMKSSTEYECDVCGESLKSSRCLTLHKKKCHVEDEDDEDLEEIEEEERPFQCDICCRTYKRASDLKRHEKTHDQNLPQKKGKKKKGSKKKLQVKVDPKTKRENRRQARGKKRTSSAQSSSPARSRSRSVSPVKKAKTDTDSALKIRRTTKRQRGIDPADSDTEPPGRIVVKFSKKKGNSKKRKPAATAARKSAESERQDSQTEADEDVAAILVEVAKSVPVKTEFVTSSAEDDQEDGNDEVDNCLNDNNSSLNDSIETSDNRSFEFVNYENSTKDKSANYEEPVIELPVAEEPHPVELKYVEMVVDGVDQVIQSENFKQVQLSMPGEYIVNDPNIPGIQTKNEQIEVEIVHMDESNIIELQNSGLETMRLVTAVLPPDSSNVETSEVQTIVLQ